MTETARISNPFGQKHKMDLFPTSTPILTVTEYIQMLVFYTPRIHTCFMLIKVIRSSEYSTLFACSECTTYYVLKQAKKVSLTFAYFFLSFLRLTGDKRHPFVCNDFCSPVC